MDEHKEAQILASKPFKTAESGHPDLIVESKKDSDLNASGFACAVATKDYPDTSSVDMMRSARPNGPHLASISNIATPGAKVPAKSREPIKKPMTPRRFVTFVCGLFIAGIAGTLTNGLINSVTETAFAPQYVKDFYRAQALQDPQKAFDGMHVALTEGQRIEPLSRRFTKLTVSLAEQLDNDGRYLEAKTEWAKAALPSEIASPEFRERKRSYLIDEAESEHLAFLSKMSTGADPDVLKEVEAAAGIFQASEVTHHGVRAVNAYIEAALLAADNKDFERADKDLESAEIIANAQWQDGGSMYLGLTKARWQTQLQQTLAQLSVSKHKPISHEQYISFSLTVENRLALENAVEARNWEKLDSIFDAAEKQHSQNFDGDTVVSDMYSILATPSDAFGKNAHRLELLEDWAKETPHSTRPMIASAYFYNARAQAFAIFAENRNGSARIRNFGLWRAQDALGFLQDALAQNSEAAIDPSFIKALQTNMSVGRRLSGWSYAPTKLVSDLRSASIAMVGDETQFDLDQISNVVLAEPPQADFMKELLQRATEQANKIGGDAGDEFYARAVSRSRAAPTDQFLDKARLIRGSSLLAKKFGIRKSILP
jgi:hypothetical protein